MKTLNLWHTPYREMWERQRAWQQEVRSGGEQLIVCTEHLPVYTLGKHGKEANVLHLPEGVECIRIDRGGDVTWHGPGQLTLYPIVDLKLLRLGVKEYVSLLEQAVIDTLENYGIKGERVEGATGVWLETGTPRERKICAIGVKVSHGVTMHGLALNVSNSIAPFAAIHPCGFTDKGVTTIALELPDTQAIPGVAEVAARIAPRLEALLTQKQ